MRLFIAVPIEERARAAIADILNGLRAAGADCKWAEPENLHLTLAFLGERRQEHLRPVERALAGAALACAPFDVELKGLGCFGPPDDPRVVWLGVSEGGRALEEAERAVRNGLAVEDFPWDNGGRDFLPHLTLGRIKSRRGLERLQELLAGPPPPGVRFRADRLVLYESRLSSAGPSHVVLRESPLKG